MFCVLIRPVCVHMFTTRKTWISWSVCVSRQNSVPPKPHPKMKNSAIIEKLQVGASNESFWALAVWIFEPSLPPSGSSDCSQSQETIGRSLSLISQLRLMSLLDHGPQRFCWSSQTRHFRSFSGWFAGLGSHGTERLPLLPVPVLPGAGRSLSAELSGG